MHTRVSLIVLGVAAGVSLAAQAAQQSLRGPVTIKTNGHTVAVSGKADTEFLFCIDQDRSSAAQQIEFSGPALVIYRPAPIAGLPAGVKISGPESVANTLTVIADDGKTWTFVGKGQQPLAADTGKAPASPTRVSSSVVRRLDWSTGSGPRRGTDVAGCLQPGG